MLSRISGFFGGKGNVDDTSSDENVNKLIKIDIKELILQLKTLSAEEKQLVKDALVEETSITIEEELLVLPAPVAPVYEYRDVVSKRRCD
jgi:hypothetical protein